MFLALPCDTLGLTYREADAVCHLVDYVGHHLATFNRRWTFEQALRKEQAWHEAQPLAPQFAPRD